MSYTIRAARPDEFAEVARMGRKFWAQTDYTDVPYSEESVCRFLAIMAGHGLLIVAESDARIVGFVGGLKAPFYTNDAVMLGQELFWWLEPEHRKGGVALQLLRAIEVAAKQAGCAYWTMVALEAVEPERAAAIYLRSGYTATERGFTKRF